MKFNVGDKVVGKYGSPSFPDDKIGEIVSVHNEDKTGLGYVFYKVKYLDDLYHRYDRELELAPVEVKYSVGDKVRVTRDGDGVIRTYTGSITKINNDWITIGNNYIFDLFNNEHEIEILEKSSIRKIPKRGEVWSTNRTQYLIVDNHTIVDLKTEKVLAWDVINLTGTWKFVR